VRKVIVIVIAVAAFMIASGELASPPAARAADTTDVTLPASSVAYTPGVLT
jgi:hypothetical protein